MGTQEPDLEMKPDRREFFKLAVGSALGARAFLASGPTASAAVHKNAPGIKLCAQSSAKPTDDELLFLKQGITFTVYGRDEGTEKIEEQTIRTEYDVTQVVLDQGAENDGAQPLFRGSPVDASDGLVRLVNARHKWQSHGPKFEPLELCHEAVTQCFRGHARLIRNEKCGSTAHARESCGRLVELQSVSPPAQRSKRYVA